MQTNNDRTLKTTANILVAATRLTREKGWKNTTIRDICAAAGVSVGAFYHHFASKQELMNHSFLMFDATLNEELGKGEGSPVDLMKSVLLTQTAFIVREAGPLITEYYQNILADKNKSAADPNREYYRSVLHHARTAKEQGLLKDGMEPEYVTELLIKFVRGCMIDWCLHDYKYDVVAQTDRELDMLLGAVCREN
jgi:AcrR family transcriptional regulator